ncbi:MAG: hypothetical protein GDA55_02025 [Cellvibrionales bacterium]|nr:hypothetical protein [Cellvibrionales bacterium]
MRKVAILIDGGYFLERIRSVRRDLHSFLRPIESDTDGMPMALMLRLRIEPESSARLLSNSLAAT